jgi:hypothetical protein
LVLLAETAEHLGLPFHTAFQTALRPNEEPEAMIETVGADEIERP